MQGLRRELLIAQAGNPQITVKALAAYLFPGEGKAGYYKANRLVNGPCKTIRVDLIPQICEFLETTPNKLFNYGETGSH